VLVFTLLWRHLHRHIPPGLQPTGHSMHCDD